MPYISAEHLARLEKEVSGDLLRNGDPGFDEARTVWNARFQRSPALIVRCRNAQDVSAAVRFAREQEIPLSVKGGGHDYAGNTVAEGSLLVDLSPMREVDADPEKRRATVGAGATWANMDQSTQAHGLATPGGTVSSVGVAGFTLGGGGGWLTRKYGLAADNLLGAEVVTATGEIVRAGDEENPDLFWAIRGGGGNFGIVTTFEYALHSVGPEVLGGQVLYPFERAGELLRWFRDTFPKTPDELMCFPFFIRIPPLDVFPESSHGQLALDFVVAYMGDPQEGERYLSPFREHGDPILDAVALQPYTALQQAFDAGMGKGNRWYSRSQHMDALPDEAIDTLLAQMDPFPGELTAVYFVPQGGAVGRVAPDAIAYPHRSSAYELHIFPGWMNEAQDAEIMAWADALHQAILPHGNGGVYVNLLGDGEEDRVKAAYGPNFQRLGQVKKTWDPENLFRRNHNIPPAD